MEQSSGIVDYESRDFRQFWETPSKKILKDREMKLVRKLLPDTEGWFFDIGAGFGRLVPAYYRENRKILLIDYSIKHLQMAAETYKDRDMAFIAANACRLPFRSSVFMNGIAVRLFHHIDRPSDFVFELARILTGEGHALISFLNKRNLLRLLRYGQAGYNHGHSLLWPATYGTSPKYFRSLMHQAGLMPMRKRGVGFLHQITSNLPILEKSIGLFPVSASFFSFIDGIIGRALGGLDLALMQYILVKKQMEKHNCSQGTKLRDILACPRCRSTELAGWHDGYRCRSCEMEFPLRGKVLDFRFTESAHAHE